MRLAVCVHTFPKLSETFVVHLLHRLVSRGHTIDIFARRQGNPAILVSAHAYLMQRVLPGEPVARPWVRRLMSAPRTRRVAKHLARPLPRLRRSEPYDIIHGQFGPDSLRVLQMRNLGLIHGPLVTSFQGYDASKVLHQNPGLYQDLARQGALFLPVSNYIRGRLLDAGFDPEKTHVHRSGIPCHDYAFKPAVAPAQGPLRLVSCCRLVEKKGLDTALRGLALLVRQGRPVSYTVIGSGPQAPHLRSLARSLEVEDHVHFTGPLKHDHALLAIRRSHVLLAPSVTAADGDQEGVPTTLKEAMALGLPVVASDHAGIQELVEHDHTGLLIPEGDEAALCRQVERLQDAPHLWGPMTHEARRRVERDYDVDTLADTLITLYRSIASRES